jgi:hypothetical protein
VKDPKRPTLTVFVRSSSLSNSILWHSEVSFRALPRAAEPM